jgi:hypothetical protein
MTFLSMKLAPALVSVVFAASLAPAALLAGDMDQNLVARWTFKNGSLKSDVGEFEFQAGGRGTMDVGDGSVTLLDRKFLFCPEISSAAMPDLQKNVTIWARVKFDQLPDNADLGVMGLQVGQEAGSWQSLVFTLLLRSHEGLEGAALAFFSRLRDGGELGVGVKRYQPVSAGDFVNVAIVFKGDTQTAGMWVSSTGQYVESKLSGPNELRDFGAFLIGKLMMPGAEVPITFDEVRIYSTTLDPQWLEEITPVKD